MKRVAIAVLVCLGLVFQAEAAEVQTSVGVRVGQRLSNTTLEASGLSPMKSTALATDLDFLRHRKWVTWGLGLRNRSADSPVGKLKYTGGSFLVGFYSNKDKARKLGWHIVGGIGVGSLSGVGNGYQGANSASQADARVGLDLVLHVTANPNPNRRPSALVLTGDLGYDVFSQRVKGQNAGPKDTGKLLSSDGILPAVGLTYYFQ